MNKENEVDEVKEKTPTIDFHVDGLGISRSSGSILLLLLQLEDENMRLRIIVDCAKQLGITLEDLTDAYTDEACGHCGISKMLHKDNNGQCF